MKSILMALLLVIMSLRPAVAGNAAKPWIGHRFQPEEVEGEAWQLSRSRPAADR